MVAPEVLRKKWKRECEKEDMIPAAINNYKKALELCPDIPEAKRRLKKLDK